jgi:ribA/ribD-fused uncharacterized protein
VDGIRYATAEHYMMIGKARLFGDDVIASQMLTAPHPGAVKAQGRQVRHFDQAVWDAHRFDLVVAGDIAKLSQHPDLGQYLSRTGNRVLVEASPVGSGLGASACPPLTHAPTIPPDGAARNLLGFALMHAPRTALISTGWGCRCPQLCGSPDRVRVLRSHDFSEGSFGSAMTRSVGSDDGDQASEVSATFQCLVDGGGVQEGEPGVDRRAQQSSAPVFGYLVHVRSGLIGTGCAPGEHRYSGDVLEREKVLRLHDW